MDDVIVVGGRCAGAPAAMLLARAGLRVRVIERSAELGDVLSGHMVKPAGAARLRAWGLLLRAQPAVMEFLAGAAPAEPVRGTGDLPTFFRVSAGPGWALAGDAGHHKDPLIARGITDAFRDAELITAAVTAGWDGDLDQALAGYTTRRDARARPLSAANDAVASGIGSVPLGPLAQALAGLENLEGALDPPPATTTPATATTRNT